MPTAAAGQFTGDSSLVPLTRKSLAKAASELSAADARLAVIIDAVGVCTMLPSREGTHFDAISRSIVYQQLSGKAAGTIHARYIEAFGRNGAPPAPHDVLAASVDDMRGVGLSAAKTAALRDLAAHVVDDRLPLDRIESMTDEAIIESLSAVRGIGRWTAQMFLMFRLGRPDVLPVLDLGVRKGAQKIYRMRALPDAERLEKVAKAWRPWRSVASWYCWRALELDDQ